MIRGIVVLLLFVALLVAPSGVGVAADDPHHPASGGAHGGGAKGPGATNPLTVDPDLAIFTFIVFLVLLTVLWKFAWGPIASALERREQGIADKIASAERSDEKGRQLLGEYEQRLAGAEQEVKQLVEQARRDGDVQRQQIVAEAQEAAKAQADRAVREIEAAKQQALGDLAERSVDTAIDLAGRVVGRELKPDEHNRLITEALSKFPSKN